MTVHMTMQQWDHLFFVIFMVLGAFALLLLPVLIIQEKWQERKAIKHFEKALTEVMKEIDSPLPSYYTTMPSSVIAKKPCFGKTEDQS